MSRRVSPLMSRRVSPSMSRRAHPLRPLRALEQARLGFLLYRLAALTVNLLAFPVLRLRPPLPAAPSVSILVPARDEAFNLPHTLPRLLAQRGEGVEVLLLDDGSSDGTGDLARQLGAKVLEGQPLPPGWHGKPWACWQLAQAARADILIFTDADVSWETGTLNALLCELERRRADLLTVWPRQQTRSLSERLLSPLIDDVLLGLLPAPLIRLPLASLSAGNGQLMAFRRAAYFRVGGHGLVRSEVLEDVRFAARLKALGGRVAVALGGDLLSVRMYRSYSGAVMGFAKSLLSVHGGSRTLLALSWLWCLAVYTLPWLTPQSRAVRTLGLLDRLLVHAKTGRTRPGDLLEVLLTPLLPLAVLPVYLGALRKNYVWKGREYRREG
ncbi:glycosyltransferase family 2 protein [Deinococcus sp. KNUC1210]|uniref:glycosyltransferase n=1 Tax=Deinococcus sp. KNUC1210 TaxID=2917691 RepID=UPI001EEFEBD1|nr:glycosyltransferase family A protein [Deinococcus sp. KNUC1210]ULH16888.1 glycosyltransferase family 2 protein [Deinococcus sp. KNUC1210]